MTVEPHAVGSAVRTAPPTPGSPRAGAAAPGGPQSGPYGKAPQWN